MKTLVSTDTVLIHANQRPPFRSKFDHWPTHAIFTPQFYMTYGASGLLYCIWTFDLKSGANPWYVYRTYEPHDRNPPLHAPWSNYVSPSGVTGFVGEWFNYTQRAGCQFKGTLAELLAWLAAH